MIFEWRARSYFYPAGNPGNFQAKLYETPSGKAEFFYGPNSINKTKPSDNPQFTFGYGAAVGIKNLGQTANTGCGTLPVNDESKLLMLVDPGQVPDTVDMTAMKELNDMKSELVRTVSHDLCGPLAYMRGYATMLPTVGEINDQQHYYLNKIVTGVDQMTSLVEGILNLRRLESGIEVMLEEVRPEQLLENVALIHEQDAEKAGLNLVTDVPTDLPSVRLDRSLMQQALSNLVGNAIKYAKESGPLILSAAADEDELIFSVQDRGPGIPADSIPRLFDEFYRVQQRGSEHVKGAGLGLSLVQSIAKRHGGRAWCHSHITQVMAGPSAGDYYNAARYYREAKKDLNQALTWMNKSIEMGNDKFWILRQKSLIEADMGNYKGAIATANQSLAKAKEAGNNDYIKMNMDSISAWSKK